MFTGIVEEIGIVRHEANASGGRRLEISAARVLERLSVDDSISVSGACLTVVARDDRSFTVDVVPETISRTTLGRVTRGSRLNLERAATPLTALGGHFVQGHVDVTTQLLERHGDGAGARLRFALSQEIARYVVEKGFIALDGVSLTIAAVAKRTFDVALIPHTAERTTLGALREGDAVNVEVDIIGKYVERLLKGKADGP
ncbi:MAG: riboflavin synthase [Chloroflexi bacterium]|nr:riboflavin synthase [Chloroflexota bacterium]